jgi:hypothetical protein
LNSLSFFFLAAFVVDCKQVLESMCVTAAHFAHAVKNTNPSSLREMVRKQGGGGGGGGGGCYHSYYFLFI